MDPANRAMLDEFLRDKTRQLFADYALDLVDGEAAEAAGESLVGVIGMVGEHLSATVAIAAGAAVLDATRQGVESSGADWIGELANQLIGRFKNELGRWGVATSIGTPVTVTGSAIGLRAGPDLSRFVFDSAHGPVHVWLKAEALRPFTLVAQATECLGEGELCLF